MGCASSAPLVQGGLDGAKQKAKQAAAEAEKIKDDAIDKMKVSVIRFTDAGEEVKEKVIELKEEVEEKVSSLASSGRESAEEAAKQAAEEATKEAEAAAKEAEEKVEEVTKDAEERIEQVTEEATTAIDEAVKEAEKHDSRASTAGVHSNEGFPSADLEDIRNEIEEDLKDMEEDARSTDVERLEALRQDIAEAGEEEREAAVEALNDKELEEILSNEKEMEEDENFRIQVGTEAEDAHGASQPPDPEENNNEKKHTEENQSNTPVETA